MNHPTSDRDALHVLTLEEIGNLTQEPGNPAETLMNVVELIASRFKTDVCSAYLLESDISWESARDQIAASADESCLGASEFLYHSPYVPSIPELSMFAHESFAPGRPLLDAAKELSHRIYAGFKYAPKTTSIEMPLADVLRNRHGVCQDFAHVMIGALRSLRLSARYVSGYVRSGSKFQGAQASHAWVSVFIPGTGWLSFDPTNDMMPSDTHVTLAWGRDYGDVTPVKGVALGGGEHKVHVEVYMRVQE